MTNLDMWSAIVGFFLRIAMAFGMSKSWDDSQKAGMAFFVCVVVAGITSYLGGNLVNDYVRSFLIIISASIPLYTTWWHKLGVTAFWGQDPVLK